LNCFRSLIVKLFFKKIKEPVVYLNWGLTGSAICEAKAVEQ